MLKFSVLSFNILFRKKAFKKYEKHYINTYSFLSVRFFTFIIQKKSKILFFHLVKVYWVEK